MAADGRYRREIYSSLFAALNSHGACGFGSRHNPLFCSLLLSLQWQT
jgi:hypothetical protein